MYHVFDLVAAPEIVLRTSGICGKALAVIDLFMKCGLIRLAKMIFFCSVGVFVGAALGGLHYVKAVFHHRMGEGKTRSLRYP